MTLEELLRDTDALTYINSLKVTLTEIKNELSEQDDLREHMNQSAEAARKLMRKADNQYRLITKLVTKQSLVAHDVVVSDDTETLEELMQEV